MLLPTDLRAVDGDDAGERARSEASNDASAEDEGGILGRRLESSTDHGEDRSAQDPVDAAEAVGDPSANEASDDAAKICKWEKVRPQAFADEGERVNEQ